ncbi:hypothetical protein TNCV_2363571 [Trichonephila clavipes]|nr:hypothetical protein TNCV_2363571 [Trichonephila clavipes]
MGEFTIRRNILSVGGAGNGGIVIKAGSCEIAKEALGIAEIIGVGVGTGLTFTGLATSCVLQGVGAECAVDGMGSELEVAIAQFLISNALPRKQNLDLNRSGQLRLPRLDAVFPREFLLDLK